MEDITYLNDHHRKEDFVMFVDSATRDRGLHPTPSEYSVFFSEPFKFVYGIDIVDALIPRTMYNVDSHTNKITFIKDQVETTVSIDVQDYTLDNLFIAIRKHTVRSLGIDVSPKTPNPSSASGKYVFSSDEPFSIDLSKTSMREVIGFDEPLTHGNPNYTKTNDDVVAAKLVITNETTIQFDSSEVYDEQMNESVQTFVSVSNVSVLRIDSDVGSVTITDTNNKSYNVPTNIDVSFMGITLSSAVEYTIRAIGRMNARNMVVFVPRYTITTPGLVNLVGERFVLIRCPEIEEHINGSFIFGKNSPGLALVKLGVMGYSNIRLDFNALKSRSFFPIGKLNRMTFRFERLDGGLYDFKGVNHTLVIIIKYMVPYTELRFSPILNPNYDPDFINVYKKELPRSNDIHQHQEDEFDKFFDDRYDDISSVEGSDDEVLVDL